MNRLGKTDEHLYDMELFYVTLELRKLVQLIYLLIVGKKIKSNQNENKKEKYEEALNYCKKINYEELL